MYSGRGSFVNSLAIIEVKIFFGFLLTTQKTSLQNIVSIGTQFWAKHVQETRLNSKIV